MKVWKWFFLLLGPLLLGLFLGVMIMVAYPNSLKAGSVLCPDDKPDAFVVRYSTTTSDGGTGTNWTLYCMSERGETEEIGTWLPLLVVCAIPVAILYGLVLLLLIRGLVRGISGGSDPPSDLTGTYLTPEQLLAQQTQAPDPFATVQPPQPQAQPPSPPFE